MNSQSRFNFKKKESELPRESEGATKEEAEL